MEREIAFTRAHAGQHCVEEAESTDGHQNSNNDTDDLRRCFSSRI